jgi:copper chaperone CopZ
MKIPALQQLHSCPVVASTESFPSEIIVVLKSKGKIAADLEVKSKIPDLNKASRYCWRML